jgi:transposase
MIGNQHWHENLSNGCLAKAPSFYLLYTIFTNNFMKVLAICKRLISLVSDVTATRLIAEIGDINAYPKADSLIAYAGLDPAVMQSGQMTGEHMHITKKGNSHLRAILYLAVINMIMSKAENMITRYVLKKKNSGLSYKAAVVAGCSKLLRLIHSMLRNGVCYSNK